MELNLLLVENEEDQRKLLRDSVDLFNKKGAFQVALDEAHTLNEGMEKLRLNSYDAAIVDLRLEKNDTAGLGNKILKEIKEKLRFPEVSISLSVSNNSATWATYSCRFINNS